MEYECPKLDMNIYVLMTKKYPIPCLVWVHIKIYKSYNWQALEQKNETKHDINVLHITVILRTKNCEN